MVRHGHRGVGIGCARADARADAKAVEVASHSSIACLRMVTHHRTRHSTPTGSQLHRGLEHLAIHDHATVEAARQQLNLKARSVAQPL